MDKSKQTGESGVNSKALKEIAKKLRKQPKESSASILQLHRPRNKGGKERTLAGYQDFIKMILLIKVSRHTKNCYILNTTISSHILHIVE